jgi:hypothetical protein
MKLDIKKIKLYIKNIELYIKNTEFTSFLEKKKGLFLLVFLFIGVLISQARPTDFSQPRLAASAQNSIDLKEVFLKIVERLGPATGIGSEGFNLLLIIYYTAILGYWRVVSLKKLTSDAKSNSIAFYAQKKEEIIEKLLKCLNISEKEYFDFCNSWDRLILTYDLLEAHHNYLLTELEKRLSREELNEYILMNIEYYFITENHEENLENTVRRFKIRLDKLRNLCEKIAPELLLDVECTSDGEKIESIIEDYKRQNERLQSIYNTASSDLYMKKKKK